MCKISEITTIKDIVSEYDSLHSTKRKNEKNRKILWKNISLNLFRKYGSRLGYISFSAFRFDLKAALAEVHKERKAFKQRILKIKESENKKQMTEYLMIKKEKLLSEKEIEELMFAMASSSPELFSYLYGPSFYF